MSSTERGNRLETEIFNLFKTEIEAGRFWAKKSCCKVYQKKSYYSRDRRSKIVFDVSIEVSLPGAPTYSLLVLIECKNYSSHAVPVDDIEEFFAKTQQVAAANSKAIVASTAAFQSGAREFAKSKQMGLLRYFGPENFKWELRRSPSASVRGIAPDSEYMVIDGLTRSDFRSTAFDLFLQTPRRTTTSLWDFFDDILADTTLSAADVRKIANPRTAQANIVPFREKPELEALAEETLEEISYSSGPVSLEAVCQREARRTGLTVQTGVQPPRSAGTSPPLGRIQFDPLRIEVFAQVRSLLGRERFTLAHELAHHLLSHGDYMYREFCDEGDFVLRRKGLDSGSDIARLEYQANYYASSLLLPRANFAADFWKLLTALDIRDRGYGALYVDSQPCNIDNFMTVTGILRSRYHVSRATVRIRLEGLGLLRDARSRDLNVMSREFQGCGSSANPLGQVGWPEAYDCSLPEYQ